MSFCGVKYMTWVTSTVLAGTVWYVGLEMERSEYDRMSRFRDKSALYAGTKPAGDTEPSWGRPNHKPWW